ncbi:MAG: aminopeptidase [Nitrososphaeria archaeon]
MGLSSSEMRTLSEKVVRLSLRIGRKADGSYESVKIVYNSTDPSCERFAEMVEEECWKTGAYTILIPMSYRRQKLFYQLFPEDSLKTTNPLSKAITETMDVHIFIGELDDPNWSKDISGKLKVDAPNRQKIREIMDNRKVRWLYFGWPLPCAAKGFGISVRRFRRIFFNSIRESFSDTLLKLCRYYRDSLVGHDMVRIEADDGTDLSFSIRDRRILVDDGIISEEDRSKDEIALNIPSGEVFVAPIEDTAEGKIYFDDVTIAGFGRAKGLWLSFQKGKVVDFSARYGGENFANFLESNTGEKDRIAELGIGCNRAAEYTGGSIIVDEKIYRTVHIAIGNNLGAYHGRNKASSHLDMIKFMHNGRVYVDGKIVMDKGEPTTLI